MCRQSFSLRLTSLENNRDVGKSVGLQLSTHITVASLGFGLCLVDHPYAFLLMSNRNAGVQTRDLRILDPQLALSSPPALLDREKAIVVNLEHVKCVITLNYVLVVNPEQESSSPLISELRAKLATGRMGKKAISYTGLSDAASSVRMMTSAAGNFDLPFELKALEVCLDLVGGPRAEALVGLLRDRAGQGWRKGGDRAPGLFVWLVYCTGTSKLRSS
jgi:hypothetical protein